MEALSSTALRPPRVATPLRLARAGDERLARFVHDGDDLAFVTLYERYHQQLYGYCRSIVRHESDAHDALQATFAGALVALRRAQRSAPVRPWLYRIAHNESITLLRLRNGATELSDAHGTPVSSAAEQAGDRERFAMLLDDLHELPERLRGALLMRELSGLSHEEIAIVLDTSPGGAKQAVFDARKGLLEFAEGRAVACEEIRRTISDGDGRVLRGRRVRAHLRDCQTCAAFAAAIPARRSELNAFVPALPAAASAAMLSRMLGAGSGHGAAGGSGAAVAATAAGKTIGAAVAAKALATVVVVASAAAGVAGVTGVLGHHGSDATAPAGTQLKVGSDRARAAAASAARSAAAERRRRSDSSTRSAASSSALARAHSHSLGGSDKTTSRATPTSARGGAGARASRTRHRSGGASRSHPTQRVSAPGHKAPARPGSAHSVNPTTPAAPRPSTSQAGAGAGSRPSGGSGPAVPSAGATGSTAASTPASAAPPPSSTTGAAAANSRRS